MLRLSLLVLAGSAIGGVGRFWMGLAADRLLGPAFPWGTLAINVTGSFVIGVAAAATDAREDVALRAFVLVGVCGGFTTFSAWSLQSLALLQEGRLPAALGYAGLSFGLCLLAVWAGWLLGVAEWG